MRDSVLDSTDSDESLFNMRRLLNLGIYTLSPTVKIPFYATEQSACFDIYSNFYGIDKIKYYDRFNLERYADVVDCTVSIEPRARAMIPTNMIFDINDGCKVLIYPRSGLSLKSGLMLANCVGVIDSDYIDPVYILLFNASDSVVSIGEERVAQGEVIPSYRSSIDLIYSNINIKSSRKGGFGHTGKG